MKIYCYYIPYKRYKFDPYTAFGSLSVVKIHGRPMYLYAWTDSKEKASRFEDMRNMSLFKKSSFNIEKEDMNDFFGLHMDASIGEYRFTSNNGNIKLLVTTYEDEVTYYNIIPIFRNFLEKYYGGLPDVGRMMALKEEYRNALDALDIPVMENQMIYEGIESVDTIESFMDYEEYKWDRVSILLYIFGEFFKEV